MQAYAIAAVKQQKVLFGRPILSTRPTWGRTSPTSVVSTAALSQRKSLHEIRGGSTEAVEGEEQATVEVEQLYLPGLLDASVVRSHTVRHSD